MAYFALLLSLLLAAEPAGGGNSPAVDDSRLHAEVTRLIGQLNSDRFEVRRRAADEFEKLVEKPEWRRGLAAEFQQVLVRPDISFEVRRQLERWSRRLPRPPTDPTPAASPAELDKLVRQLDDDSYAVRIGAARRIEWLLGNPKLICPIIVRLKQRLSDQSLDAETKQRIQIAWQLARGTWLASDVDGRELPAVSDQQIDRWLDDLVRQGDSAVAAAAREAASCELLDLLARDDYVTRLKQAIQARVAKKPDRRAAASLQALLDWTKPELVVEYWKDRRLHTQTSLLVGVAKVAKEGTTPTCFDRVDDRTAHCKSGNSLRPGSYPVGKAFPHRLQEGAFFHLVNLPTPRRRMAYVSCVNVDESKRLAALSQRTLDGLLAEKRPLSEMQLLMLAQLDPAEVSRFADKYFLAAQDRRLSQSGPRRIGGHPSQFGTIAARLAIDGSKEATTGLIEAIAKNRFLPPTLLAPYRLDLLAVLSVAARDPWPSADDWLADRLNESEPLMLGLPTAPEIGATAAAVLLNRRGQTPESHGLQPAPEPLMSDLHVAGYRFASEEARKKVIQWWTQQSSRKGP
jgi:hypothetical protein